MRFLPGPLLLVVVVSGSAATAFANTSPCRTFWTSLRTLQSCVDQFTSHRGRAPASIEELIRENILYADREPTDPWGNPFVLRRAPEGRAVVVSGGPDGTLDTTDDLRSDDPVRDCPPFPLRESRTPWILLTAGTLGLAFAALALLRRRKRTPAG